MSQRALKQSVIIALLAVASGNAASQQPHHGSEPLRKAIAASKARTGTNTRVIGGSDTTIQAHPWQVAIVDATDPDNLTAQFCGGVIIGPRWILTAAHCVDAGTTADQIEILTGTADLRAQPTRVKVNKDGIIVHSGWNFSTHDCDLALVQVQTDLSGQAIKGWRSNEAETVGTPISITGWGARAWSEPPVKTTILQEGKIAIVDRVLCQKSYDPKITDNMLCAGDFQKGNVDSCKGDSGGPATSSSGLSTELIGVTSWGATKCGLPKKPGVYVRISRFAPWVTTNTHGQVTWQ